MNYKIPSSKRPSRAEIIAEGCGTVIGRVGCLALGSAFVTVVVVLVLQAMGVI